MLRAEAIDLQGHSAHLHLSRPLSRSEYLGYLTLPSKDFNQIPIYPEYIPERNDTRLGELHVDLTHQLRG